LIYSQSSTLYGIIPHATHPSMELRKDTLGMHANGIIGVVKNSLVNQLVDQLKLSYLRTNMLITLNVML